MPQRRQQRCRVLSQGFFTALNLCPAENLNSACVFRCRKQVTRTDKHCVYPECKCNPASPWHNQQIPSRSRQSRQGETLSPSRLREREGSVFGSGPVVSTPSPSCAAAALPASLSLSSAAAEAEPRLPIVHVLVLTSHLSSRAGQDCPLWDPELCLLNPKVLPAFVLLMPN